MKSLKTYIQWLLVTSLAMLVTSCVFDAEVPDVSTVSVDILVNMEPLHTRAAVLPGVPDPGADIDQQDVWTNLAIVVSYLPYKGLPFPGLKEGEDNIYVKVITREEYDRLVPYRGDANIKVLPVNIPPGTTHVYGVAYPTSMATSLETAIEACKTDADVQRLTISNDIALIPLPEVLSVATGFYRGMGPILSSTPEKYVWGDDPTLQIPVMHLRRLATKVDIQWDAADAYPSYTDVRVKSFSFNAPSLGRLFPECAGSLPKQSLDHNTIFYNSSDISQRNGRAYHYIYSDGKSIPQITFQIAAVASGHTQSTTHNYTMNFVSPLYNGSWYKVNANIQGVTADKTIEIFGQP